MQKYLFADFESRSTVDLNGQQSVGLYNYMAHESTELLMCAFWYGDSIRLLNKSAVSLWPIWTGEECPKDLRKHLEDPETPIVAFNSSFERLGFQKFGFELPAGRFQDPQPSARMLSLPADLESVSDILGLDRDLGKDKRGSKLIDLFCFPVIKKAKKPTKKNPLGALGRTYFNDWNSHPIEWAEFCEYCKQDVVSEREVLRRLALLKVFPLPEFERKVWIFDQKVNDRGVHGDRQLATNALALATRAKKEAISAMNKVTHLENSNSRNQLLPWCQERGYKDDSLEKDSVRAELEFSKDLTLDCRKVLEMRRAASSTTYKKLAAFLRMLCPDDRLRGQFIYMGSPRCGRWTGNAVQMHNLARPEPLFEDVTVIEEARSLIYQMDYEGIIKRFGKSPEDRGAILLTVKNLIRTFFDAEHENKLCSHICMRLAACDLNAIETRVAAYLCQCSPLNDVFLPRPGKPNGNDPYIDFAASMNGMTYEQLEANYHSSDKVIKAVAKKMRQDMKPAVLGCVYSLKGGKIETDWKTGRPKKTGLLDYAAKMGVNLDEKTANDTVRFFRQRYEEIKYGWYNLEGLVADVLAKAVRVKREWGPGGIIKFDKLVINTTESDKEFGGRRNILRIHLPSGRCLHYMDARLEEKLMSWKDRNTGEDVYKNVLIYAGIDQDTHQWVSGISSHGGKILENIVQGTARDVLALKLLMFEEAGLPVVAHIHDEGVCETEDDLLASGLFEMDAIMRAPIEWLPEFRLGCDGFESTYYKK